MKKKQSVIQEVYHYRDMLGQLVTRDIKVKYRRSILGYVWSILNPLMLMIVMTIVFSTMFKKSIENFPIYLFTAQMLFNFMKAATNHAMTSITGNASLIKKTYVPQIVFTVAKVTSSLVDCIFSFGALLIIMVITRTPFSGYMFLLPLILLQVYIFSLGLGLFLAEATVFFRDIQYIYSVIVTAWMYLTPMFYPITSLSEKLQYVVTHCNPMYFYIEQFRAIALYRCFPGFKQILYGSIVAIVMLLFGCWRFLKRQDDFILYI